MCGSHPSPRSTLSTQCHHLCYEPPSKQEFPFPFSMDLSSQPFPAFTVLDFFFFFPLTIQDSSEVLPMPVSVPPPPPPPPPPVPPPPPPVSTLPKRQIMTRSKTAKLEKVGKELPAITLEDIKRVKLKSTANKDCTKVCNKELECQSEASESG